MRRLVFMLAALLAVALLVPAAALARDPMPNNELVLSSTQFWAAVIGAIVPAFTYLINHYAPWVSEPAKATFLLLASAAAGALFNLLDTGGLAWNVRTLEVVATAVVMAFAAHVGFYRPSGIHAVLKAGTNRQDG